jgi:hypothetical protein
MSGWRVEHSKGDPRGGHDSDYDWGKHTDTELSRPCLGAGNVTMHAKVVMGSNYAGSPPPAFGSAREWPVVKVHVPLPAGQTHLAPLLAARLSLEIDAFLAEHKLTRDEEEQA